MSWSFPWDRFTPFDRFSAMGEAFAHLVVLERRGQLELTASAPLRWRSSPGSPARRGEMLANI